MPIYEYACNNCGEQFEKIQKMSDDPLVDCPYCHEASLQKLVSAPAFRLKGQGWYETDFKSSKKKNLHESSTTGGSEMKKSEETKPSKPQGSTESS